MPQQSLSLPRYSRFVAAVQILGGAAALLDGAIGTRGAWWFVVLLEVPCAAAVFAGVLLWREERRAVAMTRLLLAAQVLRISTPYFAFAANFGPTLDVYTDGGTWGVRYGTMAMISAFVFGGHGAWGGAINLWALGLILILSIRSPASRASDR